MLLLVLGFGIARNILDGAMNELQSLEEDTVNLSNVLNDALMMQTIHQRRLSSIRQSLQAQYTVVHSAQEAMVANENPEAVMVAGEIPDQEDLERM